MDDLALTPLYETHAELGAKIVPFAGYALPVQYPMGVMQEHLHCRTAAGVFDVSHMGQVWIDGPSWEAVALGFEKMVPQDVLDLADGRQRYGFLTNEAGGIVDDLMFARRGDRLFIVVNGACKVGDVDLMKSVLEPELCVTALTDRALIALQGPMAETALARLNPECQSMRFMDVMDLRLDGIDACVSRSGYSGEDGFEISVQDADAVRLWHALLDMDGVAPIGLGARNSLRMEAGLCLYGDDLTTQTTPVEAGLSWAIQKVRRTGGARAGGFPGVAKVLEQMEKGAERRRVGLRPQGRAPMRDGVQLFASEDSAGPIGTVTSGGYGPSVQAPIAMGYVTMPYAKEGTEIWGDVRGKRMPLHVASLPFVPANFKR